MKLFLKLLAGLCLLIPLLYIGWGKWKSPAIKSSPQQTTASGSESLLIRGRYYEASVPPTKLSAYLSADYRLWVPDGLQTIRGLIVKQHGCGDSAAASGLSHANDLQWQALASKHRLGLIGTKLPTGDKPCEYWALINYGSEEAFFKGLQILAEKSHHPELAKVPWVLWGHSGGADWVAQMFQQYPERTIAMVVARGGAFTLLGLNPTLTRTPVLFALGAKDKVAVYETQELPRRAFHRYRKLGAPWALTFGANMGHETGATRFLAIPYLDTILNLRLPAQGERLNPIDTSKGWLGDTMSHKIAPFNKFTGNALAAAWLPNQEIALKWQEYVVQGEISPTRKPAAPTQLKFVTKKPTESLLTWSFTPDLEYGLPSFRIYKNKSPIATIKGQEHNFGDAPEFPNITLEFKDTETQSSSTYTVGAFNQLGESMSQGIQSYKNK